MPLYILTIKRVGVSQKAASFMGNLGDSRFLVMTEGLFPHAPQSSTPAAPISVPDPRGDAVQ